LEEARLAISSLIATVQDPRLAMSGSLTGIVRLVSGILALVMVFIILRRKIQARREREIEEDDI
jgi:hypothetical protein